MDNFDEHRDTSGLHKKATEALKHNRTIIWLTIIFFIITLILSWIFIYSPVARIEAKIDSTTNFLNTKANTAFDQGEEVYKFIKEVEEDFKEVVTDVNGVLNTVCVLCKFDPTSEACIILNPVCKEREARKAAKLTSGVAVITPVSSSNVINPSVVMNNSNTLSNGNTSNNTNGDSTNDNSANGTTDDDDMCDDTCRHHKKNKNDGRGALRSGYYRYRTYH